MFRKSIFAIIIILILPAFCFSQDVTLKPIVKSARTKIRVAIAPLEIQSKVGEEEKYQDLYREVLTFDLEYSDICGILKNYKLIEETRANEKKTGRMDYGAWKSFGVEAVITGELKVSSSRIILELYLDDVNDQTRIAGKRYKGTHDEFRNWLHHFSDEIVYNYTGTPGIAQTRIAFVAGDRKGKELYIIDYDGKNQKKITSNNSIVLFPSWAPDGKRLLFTSYEKGYPDLYMVNFSNGQYTKLAGFPGINTLATWHPFRDLVTIVLSKDGNPDIYTLDINTKQTERLTRDKAVESSPCWSPDGKNILYTSDDAGFTQLYVMNSSGKNRRRLTKIGTCDEGDWNPQYDKIVFVKLTSRGIYDIFVTPVDGKSVIQLTQKQGSNENPCWAPDGRHIVFNSTRSGSSQIYVMDDDGSDVRRITYGIPGDSKNPAWSPN